MPQTQKRKCSVSFGELISFLSMTEEYSLTSSNYIESDFTFAIPGTNAPSAQGDAASRVSKGSHDGEQATEIGYTFSESAPGQRRTTEDTRRQGLPPEPGHVSDSPPGNGFSVRTTMPLTEPSLL